MIDFPIWNLVAETRILEPIKEYSLGQVRVLIFDDHKDSQYVAVEPYLGPEARLAYSKAYSHMKKSRDFEQKEDDIHVLESELTDNFEDAAKTVRVYDMVQKNYDAIMYYLIRDSLGHGIIDVLMRDSDIEDISISGTNVPIGVVHRKFKTNRLLETNIVFTDHITYDSYLAKLAQRVGKHLTPTNPYVEGAIPGIGAGRDRISVVMRSGISPRGGANIRKFPQTPITITQLLHDNFMPYSLAAMLWIILDAQGIGIIYGGTGGGKTTTMNAILNMGNPWWRYVVIEDTEELTINQKHRLNLLTRKTNENSPNDFGYKKHFDISMRQRPWIIAVGELRIDDAKNLFHVFESGHGSLSTFHAASESSALQRLSSLDVLEAQKLDIWYLAHSGRTIEGGNASRKLLSYSETHENMGKVTFKKIVRYDRFEKTFDGADLETLSKTSKMALAAEVLSVSDPFQELQSREKFLRSCVSKKVFEQDKVMEEFVRFHMNKEKGSGNP